MKISAITEKFNELRKEIKKLGGEAFYQELKPLFKKYPEVESVYWNQYTPHFNDGDTCKFSVKSWSTKISIDDEFIGEGDSEDKEGIREEFQDLIKSIDDEIFLITFGDHVEITINRDGTVEVEEYEHD